MTKSFNKIESSTNKLIKKLRALGTKKGRDEYGAFIVEGEKFILEISGYEIENIVVSEDYYNNRPAFLADLPFHAKEFSVVKDGLFKTVSDAVSPQGIMAVCSKKNHDFGKVKKDFLVLLEDVADPGNVGTIIRTADAFGATGVLLTKNCADIYGSKVVRSTAGSLFHIPVIDGIDTGSISAELKRVGVTMISTMPESGVYPSDVNFTVPFCIMLGNEAHGMSEMLNGLADAFVKIPMPGRAESLNVSIAAGVLLHEAARQRISNKYQGRMAAPEKGRL